MSRQVRVAALEKIVLSGFLPPESLARSLRRADDFIRLSVASADRAMRAAPPRDLQPEDTGIFIGTAYGPLETNFSSLGSLILDGEGQISPTLFSHSVFNAAAGYVARLLNIHGPALTLTTYSWPFLTALNQARLALLSRRILRAVVVGVETYSALLEDAYKRLLEKEEVPWQPGAVAWVLDPDDQAGPPVLLGEIVIEEKPCAPGVLLSRSGERWQGEGLRPDAASHPLAYAYALTDAAASLAGGASNVLQSRFEAPFGEARVEIVNQSS